MADKVTPISGFQEWLPAERIVEQHFLDTLRAVFELHGFASVNTRAVETVDRLAGNGEDADKEIYGVRRLADAGGQAEFGLHFDLTVPFARYVLENAGKLNFPFRRYQIQPAWRGERPQRLRYREFTQADIDIVDVGELPFHYEVELPLAVADAFSRLPVPAFRIHVNNRKIPEGFYRGLGISDVTAVLRIVDKLDKLPAAAVGSMLVEAGLTAAQAEQCLALAQINSVDDGFVERVRVLGVTHPTLDEGLAQLKAVMDAAAEHAPGLLFADLMIARGLDYYTGTVYEIRLLDQPEGTPSVGGGGRYDALASDGKRTYPGVGISIGVSRLLGLLIGEQGLTASRETPVCVLVAVTDEQTRPESMRVAAALRARGIPTLVAPKAAKFGKQIQFADRRGIPFVWFPAAAGVGTPGEGAAGEGAAGEGAAGESSDQVKAASGAQTGDQVKDIRTGEQVPADRATWLPADPTDLHPTLSPKRQ
ncbi:histidine--tRNA ligase [Calidifontibacter sp. DB0510]|uniref:Histidine--tRNA ligase n=1 Tax=Metallococcus carri TaxID=1656884 RepID=A0A967EB70_9MICO|nr:histidine--tRNA ligase [Metallococcus carri]NHN57000.1 histidine--tRNA ligase [Metallococcus carri]NOP37745.1 histidine--tRNA ligase [Calidifontibacter sp. DB2511S]